MGIGKGLLRSLVPEGNDTRLSRREKQLSPEQVVEMPHFGHSSRAGREGTHPHHQPSGGPTSPGSGGSPRPVELGSFGFNRRVRCGGGSSAGELRGLFADLPGLRYNRCVSAKRGRMRRALPAASRRAHGRELVLSLTQPKHGLSPAARHERRLHLKLVA